MTLSDFIEELNIAIRQDGHDIYCNASTAEIIKRCLIKQNRMSKDIIYRQDAIDAIEKTKTAVSPDGECYVAKINAQMNVQLLPSAQPEPMCINLNEPIKVKLTDWGKEIYYHQYDRINQIAGREICKPRFPREDENGYTEFQLWCFIELYGEHMGMAMPNVIEPLEIVYER